MKIRHPETMPPPRIPANPTVKSYDIIDRPECDADWASMAPYYRRNFRRVNPAAIGGSFLLILR